MYSTFIGGLNNEVSNSITLDTNENSYITGTTNSTDYPTTSGAYETSNFGAYDVFVSKLNSSGSALIYSTYIGGSGNDYGNSISINNFGNAYLTGWTKSSNYPTTGGSYDSNYHGGVYGDAFVTKLNSSGTALIYSTYIGGTNYDYGNSITIDNSGNAVLTGSTQSLDYPTTYGAYNVSFEGTEDVFVTKFNNDASSLIFSTLIGGSNNNQSNSITHDNSGNVYLTGFTFSSDYPTTSGAFNKNNNGNWDSFVTELNNIGSSLVYSTYIGGANLDCSISIALDNYGIAYISGITYSSDFPTTTGSYDVTYNDSIDVFVTKLNFDVNSVENKSQSKSNLFSISPNPAVDYVHINLNKSSISTFSIKIINDLGEELYNNQYLFPDEDLKIDVSNYPSGVYYCLVNSNSMTQSEKFLVVH